MSPPDGPRESRADLTLGIIAVIVAIVLGAITQAGLPRGPAPTTPVPAVTH